MNDPRNRTGRAARDQLVSLLGLGVPRPLIDLEIDYAPEVVYGASTDIRIRGAQAEVRYQLCDEDGNPLPNADQYVAQLSADHGAEAAVLGSTLLTIDDVRDRNRLLRELTEASEGVSGWLWQRLTPETQEQLRTLSSDPVERRAVLGVLLDEANVLVRQASFYDAERFQDVSLSPWTRQLIAKPNLTPTEQTRLNRFLLEDAYPLILWRALALPTPPIKEDVTFTVLAIRTGAGNAPFLEAYLAEAASLRAGITVSLKVQFAPDLGSTTVANFGDLLTVDVAATQEGVSYQLFLDQETEVPLSDPLPGNRVIVSLTTRIPASEDFRIKVKAYRTSTPSQAKFLDARLAVAVRPNPKVAAAATPPIVDFAAATVFSLTGAQATADYHLFKRTIALEDFVDVGTPGALSVPTTDRHSVSVLVPPRSDTASAPPGFELVGAFAATGGTIKVATGNLQDDTLFAVRATKKVNRESLFLEQYVAVLVRPNPAPEVGVDQSPIASGAAGLVFVSHTQKGVRYQLRSAADGSPVGLPGWHFEDRGVESTRLEVDFVVEGTGDERVLLPTNPLDQTASFGVVAIKNTTGLSAGLNGTAVVQVTLPVVAPDLSPSLDGLPSPVAPSSSSLPVPARGLRKPTPPRSVRSAPSTPPAPDREMPPLPVSKPPRSARSASVAAVSPSPKSGPKPNPTRAASLPTRGAQTPVVKPAASQPRPISKPVRPPAPASSTKPAPAKAKPVVPPKPTKPVSRPVPAVAVPPAKPSPSKLKPRPTSRPQRQEKEKPTPPSRTTKTTRTVKAAKTKPPVRPPKPPRDKTKGASAKPGRRGR